MIHDLINLIEDEILEEESVLNRVSRRLGQLPDYTNSCLAAHRVNGKLRYYIYERKDGRRNWKYIRKAQYEMVSNIQEQSSLEIVKKNCEINIGVLKRMNNLLQPIDPYEIANKMPLAYRDQHKAHAVVYGFSSVSRWKIEKEKLKSSYPPDHYNNHDNIASDGTPTRSKSEAIIIDILNSKGIPYVYECPMWLGHNLRQPDFIIYNKKSHRELILEHMGLLSDKNYMYKQLVKLGEYIEAGYVPNKNLFMTFDDKEGKIDVRSISKYVDYIMTL